MSQELAVRLEGKKSYLVPFTQRHLNTPAYLEWLRDYDVVKTINRPEYLTPISFEEVRAYCERVMTSETDMFFAVHEQISGSFSGTLRVNGINRYSMVADIGILLGRPFWGKGIATDAVGTVCRYLFENLKFRKLTAGMMAVNPAMARVFEKMGFRREGILRRQDKFEGQYVDHIYMGCFREEFTGGVSI